MVWKKTSLADGFFTIFQRLANSSPLPRTCYSFIYILQSVLPYLPDHVTGFPMPYGIGEIDCLNRFNVIEIRSAVQWHSLFAFFFPFFYTTWQKVLGQFYGATFFVNFCFFILAEFFLKNFLHVFNPVFFCFQPVIFSWFIEIVTKEPPFLDKIGNPTIW